MSWVYFSLTAFFVALGAWAMGLRDGRKQMLAALPPKLPNRDDEMVLVHEGAIDGDALRFTVRTKKRIMSFLVPREVVYQMSDDLMRAAAQLGKRTEVQRGPE